MITEINIVKIDFFIEWKVSDPQKYLFNSIDRKKFLETQA